MSSSNQQSPEMKQDDKFFNRIMSKENSTANSSSRAYYRGVSGSVPFVWESCPGTPKHALSDYNSSILPLTPPPSYFSRSMPKSAYSKSISLANICRKLLARKSTTKSSEFVSQSSSIYSSSSSSSSSSRLSFYNESPSSKWKKRLFSWPSPIGSRNFLEDGHGIYKEDQNVGRGITWCRSPFVCYGMKRKVSSGTRINLNIQLFKAMF